MKLKKKIGIGVLLLLILAVSLYGSLILYGLRQGAGQFKVLWNAVPVEVLMADPNTPDSLKSKLELIAEVRTFAVEELGMKDSENYTSLYDQKGKAILWNVSASEKFKLEAYEWKFPLLGKFSYKGYFNYELALKEEERLKAKGLDTRVRTVGGWSTLGWFNDPILSNMLNRSEGQLAELILHELVHGNIYVKDSVDFNENLATFFGQKGAIQFMIRKFGEDSEELREYLDSEIDFEKYTRHMLRGSESLDSLYKGMESMEDPQQKELLKEKQIQKIIESLDTLSFLNPEPYEGAFQELPNNAYFMALNRYRSKTDWFENELEQTYQGDLKAFLQFLIRTHPSL